MEIDHSRKLIETNLSSHRNYYSHNREFSSSIHLKRKHEIDQIFILLYILYIFSVQFLNGTIYFDKIDRFSLIA